MKTTVDLELGLFSNSFVKAIRRAAESRGIGVIDAGGSWMPHKRHLTFIYDDEHAFKWLMGYIKELDNS